MNDPPRARTVSTPVVVVVLVAAVGFFAGVSWWLHHRRLETPRAVEGKPLLESAPTFVDQQLNWQFTPPTGWAMQARSLEVPNNPRPERMIVKYKQFIPGQPPAWLRISVAADNPARTPSDWLRDRKPPEAAWKRSRELEGEIKVGSQSAARIAFSGPFDTDGRGQREYTCEVTALAHNGRVFFLAGYFPTGDTASQQRIRAAIESVQFTK